MHRVCAQHYGRFGTTDDFRRHGAGFWLDSWLYIFLWRARYVTHGSYCGKLRLPHCVDNDHRTCPARFTYGADVERETTSKDRACPSYARQQRERLVSKIPVLKIIYNL